MIVQELIDKLTTLDPKAPVNVLSYYFTYGVPKPIANLAHEVIVQDGKVWISGQDK